MQNFRNAFSWKLCNYYWKAKTGFAGLTHVCSFRINKPSLLVVAGFSPGIRHKWSIRKFTTTGTFTMSEKKNEGTGYQLPYQAEAENGITADLEVDLRSDTLTKPSQAMRDVMTSAIVGDDVLMEDPTTNEFEAKVAKMLGKEAALFVSSGTQGNLICNLVHCNVRGSELICGNESHVYQYEQGGIAQFGGIHSCQIPNEPDGTFKISTLKSLIRMDDIHVPITKVVCVENTHNRCGGRVLPLPWLDELAKVCKEYGIAVHMDGARLFNAAVASGVKPSRIVRDMDSVSFCLSKGLGAPVGSVIVGTKKFIDQARRMRKALGGALRQCGILTAAGNFCMDQMIERLKEDHDNAKRITKIINAKGKKYVWVDEAQVETNLVMLHVNVGDSSIFEFCKKLNTVEDVNGERTALGGKTVAVKAFPFSLTTVRLVLYFGISPEMAEAAANKICYVAEQIAKSSNKTA